MSDNILRAERWHATQCYCGGWEKNPQLLEDQGLPRGFCGRCRICGKPGHTLHFPGAVPFTGAWCKFHYYRTMILHPKGAIGVWLWGAIVLGIVIAMVRKLHI